MAHRFRHFRFLALGLIAAAPLSATAQSLPRMVPADCPLEVAHDLESFCRMPDMAMQDGVTLVTGSNNRSELADNDVVVATLGVTGPSVVRSAMASVATSGGDVGITGSISTPAAGK